MLDLVLNALIWLSSLLGLLFVCGIWLVIILVTIDEVRAAINPSENVDHEE